MSALDELVDAVGALPAPAVVGLSGFGGAGKSTLAAALATARPDVRVVPGDGFLLRGPCGVVDDDWAGVDRARLRRAVLDPFRAGLPVRWDAYGWEADAWFPKELPPGGVLVVEGIGVIHPSLHWDLAVWLDVDPDVALARAVARDTELGHDLTGWDVWHQTDRRFFARHRPDLAADLVLLG